MAEPAADVIVVTATFFSRGTIGGYEVKSDKIDHRIERASAFSDAPCFFLELADIVNFRGTTPPRRSVLLQAELLRALWGGSSHEALVLFDGVDDPIASPDRALVNFQTSRVVDCSTVILECSRKPTRREAIMAAHLLTNETFKKAHRSIASSLLRSPLWKQNKPAWPPWIGHSNIRAVYGFKEAGSSGKLTRVQKRSSSFHGSSGSICPSRSMQSRHVIRARRWAALAQIYPRVACG